MLGALAGGFLSTLRLKRKKSLVSFMGLEIGIIIFSLVLPCVFLIIRPHLGFAASELLVKFIFLMLCFTGGFLTAAEFPLANKIYLGKNPDLHLGRTAGLLYSADLVGGFLAGIVGGLFFLPILGLVNTFFVLVIFKLTSLITLFLFSKLNLGALR